METEGRILDTQVEVKDELTRTNLAQLKENDRTLF